MRSRGSAFSALCFAFVSGCSSDAAKPPEQTWYSRDKLLDPATCNECHQDHYKEWAGSMHAYASKDPLFRAMNKRGQEETHGTLGNFCVHCHAPMAEYEMNDGGEATIDPATIPEKLSGITCYFCHNAVDVTGTHNNPVVLGNDITMRAAITDPKPFKAHPAAYSPLLDSSRVRSANLCGSCHDIVVPAHLGPGAPAPTTLPDGGISGGIALERTFDEWKGSNLGTVPGAGTQPCGACHMFVDPRGAMPIADPRGPHPTMPGSRIRHQHDFPAVDTAFSEPDFPTVEGGADIRQKQLAAVQDELDRELRVETCVDSQFGHVLVTLENQGAGHRFPSGASQDRRLWIQVHVTDGKNTYDTGDIPLGASVVETSDAELLQKRVFALYRDVTTKDDGTPAHMFWDVKHIEPKTIPVANPDEVKQGVGNRLDARFSSSQTAVPVPQTVDVTVWLEPVGRDVINDLVTTGHLSEKGPEATLLPRFALIPHRLTDGDAGSTPVTLRWTRALATVKPTGYSSNNADCMQTNPNQFSAQPPTK
jgi:hypothetical protein